VNLDVVVYIKTRIRLKVRQKNAKIIPKYKLNTGPIFTFRLPGGAIRPPIPCQLNHLQVQKENALTERAR